MQFTPSQADPDGLFLTDMQGDVTSLLRYKDDLNSAIGSLTNQKQALESAIAQRQQEMGALDRRFNARSPFSPSSRPK
jgi:hypothetical protein